MAVTTNTKVVYNKSSPYSHTGFYGDYLDVANLPVMPRLADDVLFTVNKTYQYRPDLLAFDLYGDAGYWWVFSLRNPNAIKDPVFDMRVGARIYLPKKETITAMWG